MVCRFMLIFCVCILPQFFANSSSFLFAVLATVFAYGQSGSGKTYTMTGEPHNPDLEGKLYNDECVVIEHKCQ